VNNAASAGAPQSALGRDMSRLDHVVYGTARRFIVVGATVLFRVKVVCRALPATARASWRRCTAPTSTRRSSHSSPPHFVASTRSGARARVVPHGALWLPVVRRYCGSRRARLRGDPRSSGAARDVPEARHERPSVAELFDGLRSCPRAPVRRSSRSASAGARRHARGSKLIRPKKVTVVVGPAHRPAGVRGTRA
jgi:hypothetical protein